VAIFYVPDVAWIKDRKAAMHNIERYIGDGATVKHSMARKPSDTIIGHVSIQTQLTWCQKMRVKKAIFTHLGSQVVEENEQKIQKQIIAMAQERGLEEADIADDNLSIILR
jgi:phosphoribosyl 1,2-cyclic phosphodiesterase